MDIYRKVPHPHDEREDENFPFDKNFNDMPINAVTKTHIEPPFLTVNRLYFDNADEKKDKSVPGHIRPLTVSEKRGLPIPSQHKLERKWKLISPEEIRHAVGFQPMIPNGLKLEVTVPPWYGIYLPPLTTCEQQMYDYRVDTPDARMRKELPNLTHNSEEPSARAMVMAAKDYFLVTREHPEDRISSEEHGCWDPNIPVDEWQNKRNNFIPMCAFNTQLITIVSKLNLNDQTQENNQDVIHFHALRIDLHKDPTVMKYMMEYLNQSPYKYANYDSFEGTGPAEIETGILVADASLLMSIDHQKRKEIENIPMPYLNESARLQREKREHKEHGLMGPPIGNASQRLAMAEWYDHCRRMHKWTDSDLASQPAGKGLALVDPRKFTHTSLCAPSFFFLRNSIYSSDWIVSLSVSLSICC